MNKLVERIRECGQGERAAPDLVYLEMGPFAPAATGKVGDFRVSIYCILL